MNNTQATFGDKERMNDLLFGEKQLCAEYCSFLCEAATPEVVRTLSTLLTDTHDAQHTLFQERPASPTWQAGVFPNRRI